MSTLSEQRTTRCATAHSRSLCVHFPSFPPPSPAGRRVVRAALIGLAPATGFAKEIGSGGATGGVTTPTCSPVSSLVVKGDAKTAETGLASIAVSYGVKPCTNGQAVTASVTISEYLNPSVVVYDNPGAPLNGKFTVFGVRLSTSHKVTVTVVDTATGTIAGSLSAYVAAVPRGV